MAKTYGKSNGAPECPTGDLGGFGPSGKPDQTNIKGSVAFEGRDDANAALATFGGVSRAKKNDGVTAHGSASIPKSGPA